MKEAIDFLYRLPHFTEKNPMDHTREFLRRLGDPQESVRAIHIAGSNGKGSTASFLFHMLLASGKHAGLFTSPHLVDIRERFVTDRGMCTEAEFLGAYGRVREVMDEMQAEGRALPTFFECVFAIGMLIFQRQQVEWAVLEAGMGGLSDTTNVILHPAVSVITSVSLEHTEYLGETIEEIAGQKAGIIREGVPVVFDGKNREAAAVIRQTAGERHAPAFEIDPARIRITEMHADRIAFSLKEASGTESVWQIPFAAEYQTRNAALALTAWRCLEEKEPEAFPEPAIQEGFRAAKWPGRMQQIRPGIYLDGAHNADGIREFVHTAKRLCKEDPYPPLLLFSMVKEKDIESCTGMLAAGIGWERIMISRVPGERGVSAERVAEQFREHRICAVDCCEDPAAALEACIRQKQPGQKLFCTGSLYFIGELMKALTVEREENNAGF